MGSNFWKDSGLTRDQVLHDINSCNKITQNRLFYEKTNLSLLFLMDDQSSMNRRSKKIIAVKISTYSDKTKQIKPKTNKNILIDDFYKFSNSLNNCLPMFYDEKLKERIRKKKEKLKKDDDDDDSAICSICDENIISVQLSCGHFFCKNCIQTWINNKSKTCPMCRDAIEIDPNKKIKNSAEWDVVDDKKITKSEMEKENQETFFKIIGDLFN